VYGLVMRIRNIYYDIFPGAVTRAGVPVISIGNITVGGTGKTPMTVEIAQRIVARDHRVAVLTRGYKSEQRVKASAAAPGGVVGEPESDEAMLLRRNCPQAMVVIHPKRVLGAQAATEAGAEVLVMDDGFQHRKLGRDFDIVLVDAIAPFGYGAILPRGLLREPRSSLRRADLIVITRSDQITDNERKLLRGRIERIADRPPIVEASHRIVEFADLRGERVPLDRAEAMRAVIFAGIANFEGFRRSVEELGVEVAAAYEYPDHHEYASDEIAGLRDVAETLEANAILTTEKDAVKLENRWQDGVCRLLVLKLAIEFDADGDRILETRLDALLARAGRRKP
ncbi:MAG: tetraacyldisaccharide 4'-kinase, partial [Phycisphaerales bacterium]|nr:tetraacyldisaccharide 4'-kinase [Phycisphaerales bacterium]